MNGTLVAVTIVGSLVLAAWSLLAAVRNRPPDLSHLAGLAVLEAALVVLAVLVLLAWAGGRSPDEVGTFVGYLITLLCLPPLAAVLARMEPTRWGSIIVLVVCLVIPVVVVRLQQTWQVASG